MMNERAPDRRITAGEHLQRIVGQALGTLPGPVLVRLSGRSPVVMDGQTLDPHVQLVLAMRKKRGVRGLVEPSPAEGRARFRHECRVFGSPQTKVGAVRDFEIPGPAGLLRVRHYAPADADGPQPLTVYLHGGGFTIGDLDTHDEPCRLLCRHGRVHVLSVDYRLAPEHPFPAAPDDAAAALRWAQAHAAELGADAAKVGVGGDSAGGNLAAVASIEAARGGHPPAAQLLIYPVTDKRRSRPSEQKFSDGFFLSTADRKGFSTCYTGGSARADEDPRVSPLLTPELGGLPPALVVTAGFDILRDEGEAYAAALEAAGTKTRHVRVPSLGHGFLHMTTVTPAAHKAMVRIAQDWRALLDETGG